MDDERAEAQAQILGAMERMGRLLREMSQGVAKDVATDHASTRATMAIARLLDGAGEGGEVGVGDVAEALRVDISVASRQVSDLVTEGLVERTVVDGDRRARHLRLTAAGRAYADDLRTVMQAKADITFACWSVDELRAAATTLDHLVASVAGFADCQPATHAVRRAALSAPRVPASLA
jgi:DNA-binding MarR family transcriptional regulator